MVDSRQMIVFIMLLALSITAQQTQVPALLQHQFIPKQGGGVRNGDEVVRSNMLTKTGGLIEISGNGPSIAVVNELSVPVLIFS